MLALAVADCAYRFKSQRRHRDGAETYRRSRDVGRKCRRKLEVEDKAVELDDEARRCDEVHEAIVIAAVACECAGP